MSAKLEADLFSVLHLRLLMVVLIIVKGELARGLCAQDVSDHASRGNKVLLQLVKATLPLRCGPETPDSHDSKVHGRGPTAQRDVATAPSAAGGRVPHRRGRHDQPLGWGVPPLVAKTGQGGGTGRRPWAGS